MLTYSDETIIDLREQGLTCREVAERIGIPESRVWACMRRNGTTGIKAKTKARPVKSLSAFIEKHGAVYIEAGLNGGYIATINDATGEEKQNILGALYSAEERAL